MFCTNCGTQLPEDASFCTSCGMRVPKPGAVPEAPPAVPQGMPPQPEFPMKWFKFVIYVQLFLAALSNLATAMLNFTGTLYGSDSDLVYLAFGGLRALDILMGVICLALAAYAIFVRFQLAKFKRNAPVLLHILFACNIGVSLFYGIGATIIIGQNMFNVSTISNFLTTIVILVLNVVYFNKRTSLFIN